VQIRVEADGAVVFEVRVVPRAGRDAIRGAYGDGVKIALAAAPVDGAANDALIAVVASALGVGRRDVEIVSGEKNRSKRVRVRGTTEAAVRALGRE
jgi:uncharacterized protein